MGKLQPHAISKGLTRMRLTKFCQLGGTVDDSGKWDPTEVSQAVQVYKADLERSKEKSTAKKAPEQGSRPIDLGF